MNWLKMGNLHFEYRPRRGRGRGGEGRKWERVTSTVMCDALLLLLLFYNRNIYFLPQREHFICSAKKKNRLKMFIVWTIQNKKYGVDKKNQLDVTFVFFISLLIVAQHVSGNHVPIIRSWRLCDVIASCRYVPWLQEGCQDRLAAVNRSWQPWQPWQPHIRKIRCLSEFKTREYYSQW